MYSGTLPSNYMINPPVASIMERVNRSIQKYTIEKSIALDTLTYYTIIYNIYTTCITLLSGIVTILSFLNSSSIFDITTTKLINIICGAIGIIITILHNISNGYKYQTKMETYKIMSNNYTNIISDISHNNNVESSEVLDNCDIKHDIIKKHLNNILPPNYIIKRYK